MIKEEEEEATASHETPGLWKVLSQPKYRTATFVGIYLSAAN